MNIAETLAGLRASLSEVGVPDYHVTLAVRDQAEASFRVDLVSLGLDPSQEGTIAAAIAGLIVGVKLLIQQQVSPILISQYVGVAETLLPMISNEPTDVSTLPDMDFLSQLDLPGTQQPEVELCSMCHQSPAVLDMGNGSELCTGCARGIVTGGMQAMRLSGMGPQRPQVGGPGFQRGPDVEPTETEVVPTSFWDRTVSEVLGRGKHRKKRT